MILQEWNHLETRIPLKPFIAEASRSFQQNPETRQESEYSHQAQGSGFILGLRVEVSEVSLLQPEP